MAPTLHRYVRTYVDKILIATSCSVQQNMLRAVRPAGRVVNSSPNWFYTKDGTRHVARFYCEGQGLRLRLRVHPDCIAISISIAAKGYCCDKLNDNLCIVEEVQHA